MRYPGDVRDADAMNPTRALEAIQMLKRKILWQSKCINRLKVHNKWLVTKTDLTQSTLKKLKRRSHISKNTKNTLQVKIERI